MNDTSTNVEELRPAPNTIGKVLGAGTLYYSGEAWVCPDGSVWIPELDAALSPGDIVYHIPWNYKKPESTVTLDRDMAYAAAEAELDEGCGVGVLETLVSANNKIDRTYTDKSPGFSDESDIDSLFSGQPSYKNLRYKVIKDTTHTYAEWHAAEKIDKAFGNVKPTVEALKTFYLNGLVDEDLALRIGGYLHIDDSTKMTPEMFAAVNAWQSLGGQLGKTVLDAAAKMTGDYKHADMAAFVHDLPRSKRCGNVEKMTK